MGTYERPPRTNRCRTLADVDTRRKRYAAAVLDFRFCIAMARIFTEAGGPVPIRIMAMRSLAERELNEFG